MEHALTNTMAEQVEPEPGSPLLIPIKSYFILMNLFLLCLLLPGVSYFFYVKAASFRDAQLEHSVKERTEALHERATQFMRTLSHSGSQAIADYNFTFLASLVEQAVSGDETLLACQFVSKKQLETTTTGGRLADLDIQSSFRTRVDVQEISTPSTSAGNQRLLVSFIKQSPPGFQGQPLLLAEAPVLVGKEQWGSIYAAFSLEPLQREIEQSRQEWSVQLKNSKVFFLSVTSLFFVLGIISAIFFTTPLIRAIKTLRDGVEQVANGDLNHSIHLDRISCSEFASLANSFNSMTSSLHQSRQQLDDYSRSLETRVAERTRELREAQSDLVNQAHQAGMAEMAVGVLHNIGNAITPAKVGIELLIRHLQESRLRSHLEPALQTLPALIDQAPGLADADKEFLRSLILLLPKSLQEEFDLTIRELERISDKHHYIENIIHLQMHYARLGGASLPVDPERLVHDALKLLDEGLRQHRIEVELDIQPLRRIRIEESKLLQILINLIKNGYEAMAQTPIPERRLRIEGRNDGPDILLTVSDRGCGFSPDDRQRMFQFGFSTKERGSGFGLHSCANFLKANNGSIEFHSDGPGTGARFSIRLPAITTIEESAPWPS